MADDKDISTINKSFKLMSDGMQRMTDAMREAGEAASAFFAAIDALINEELERLTPAQCQYYHQRVSSGAYKLEALDDAKRFVD